MAKQVVGLSIVLLISIIINVAFVFDRIAGKHKTESMTQPKKTIEKQGVGKIGSQSDLVGSFIVELVALKNLATEEGAEMTAKAADMYIMMKKSQFEALDANMPIKYDSGKARKAETPGK